MSARYWDASPLRDDVVAVALGERPADLVIRGGRLVDVHTCEIRPAGVAVAGSRIAAVGEVERCIGDGTTVVEAEGRYLVPGFFDCHLHVGPTSLVMTEFARLVVPMGTAAIVTDFGEALAMRGPEAVRFFLDETARTPLTAYLSPFYYWVAKAGVLPDEEFAAMLTWPETVELREWLVASERNEERHMGIRARELGLKLCGNLTPMPDPALQASVACGAHSDHEARTAEQALARVRLGVAEQLRWSSSTRDHHMTDMLRAVVEHRVDTRMFMFSSDEFDLDDGAQLGHIDYRIRLAIKLGVPPVQAIQMASLNAASYLGVTGDLGSVSPGRLAFVNLVDDLADVRVSTVVAGPQVVAQDGRFVGELAAPTTYPPEFLNTVSIGASKTADDFRVRAPDGAASATARVIDTSEHRRYDELLAELPVRDGAVGVDVERDIAKVAIVERHRGTGAVEVAFIKGYGVRAGAFGTSYPGRQNIVMLGADDGDLAVVANRIAELGGGFVAARDGEVLAELALPVFGLLSTTPAEEAVAAYLAVLAAIAELGCTTEGLYTQLMVLCLPVIPGLHPSVDGLIRVDMVDEDQQVTPVAPILSAAESTIM